MRPFITGASIAIILLIAQAFTINDVSKTEQYRYEVIQKFPSFEVRKYEPALFSSITLEAGNYKDFSSAGFRVLASYIFGGNERNENIAMTSPVLMEIGSQSKMMFMVPSGYAMEDLPAPDHEGIKFEKSEAKTMAAIQFGGWANDEKIDVYRKLLSEALSEAGISHTNQFLYFGYNPPYEVLNRRNEVVVELIDFKP